MTVSAGGLNCNQHQISEAEIASRPAPFNQLTMLEANTLAYVFAHYTAKEIAQIEGVTPDAIVARINRARRKLGNVPRNKASRMVVEQFGESTYQRMVSQSLGIPPSQEFGHTPLASAGTTDQVQAARFNWPVPTKGRPTNDDSQLARLIWPVVLALVTIIAMILLQSLMIGLNGHI
ncbi:MAG: hypothetical protein ABL882_01510 [Sphingopyxis sp.]